MVTFLCGVPCAGKTTYRQKHFPDVPYVDILDFQKYLPVRTKENVLESYYKTQQKSIELALKGDVVVEQTALRSNRRIEAVKALRDAGYTGEIHLIFLIPSRMELLARAMNRFGETDATGTQIEEYIDTHLSIMQMPTDDEGFDTITIVEE